MKQQHIKEFNQLLKGKTDFENGHFYTLFMEIEEEDIELIYKNIPHSNKLTLLMKNYLCLRDIPLELTSAEMLRNLIMLDFEEKKPLFEHYEYYKELLNKWEFRYIEDYEQLISYYNNDELTQKFFDKVFYFYENKISKKALYFLNDALYGITTDFDLQLYLMAPLLTFNYTGEYLFQFIRLGGAYAIHDNIVYYSYKKPGTENE